MDAWSEALNSFAQPESILSEYEVTICCKADGTRHTLGEGAFGEVYKAECQGCPVALKIFKKIKKTGPWSRR
ncbi:hypothetical protein WJX73_001966 [Symbiochloris irregularis]|uniref:Protein kinase domain-containing protein n=1 Tax=Symbiochloris irregularis TaxID=706552 RepID=A0AAW1NKL7_9CHLO